MEGLFTVESLVNLLVLIFLQAVLGFDNLLYISLESKRVPEEDRPRVRKLGIGIAIALRIVLLFVVVGVLERFRAPLFEVHAEGIFEGELTVATFVFFGGGAFIIYTAVKEIWHMLEVDDLEHEAVKKAPASVARAITMIVIMNLVFSFDSILSALAITEVFAVLAIAIVSSGLLMMFAADRVARFLNENKKYEVLGLFILLLVGVVLLGEGGHVAHMKVFDQEIHPMSKMTFYFSIVVLVIVDVLQTGYQRKLKAARRAGASTGKAEQGVA
ncbi:MAG TPA: hypothetical protein RMH99_04015 [Sandaracinaceae bacterium LLY-WYZ-13_1]|nr:hypothetical protein [Sandaracinaceae bacterium LLY-WYZ-13_1]